MNEIRIKLSDKIIRNKLDVKYPEYRIVVDKSEIGNDENEKLNHNILALARKNNNVKDFVIDLANNGFFLIDHKKGISVFEKFLNAKQFKNNLKNMSVEIFGDLYYTLDEPKINSKNAKLLVVFSSVADSPLNASIARRNFYENFSNIGKYIPYDTYILRISDIGSVVGSFYLNSIYDNEREEKIQCLLSTISNKIGVNKPNIILYGVSKGGTASLYHGIIGGYKAISVDPIITDEYHEKNYNDCHFTKGTFPISKQEKFEFLFKNYQIKSDISIIYSEKSPIYPYINKIVRTGDFQNKIRYINVINPNIKDHPDVGPNTINILTSLLNSLYYNYFSDKNLIVNYTGSDEVDEDLDRYFSEGLINYRANNYSEAYCSFKKLDLLVGNNRSDFKKAYGFYLNDSLFMMNPEENSSVLFYADHIFDYRCFVGFRYYMSKLGCLNNVNNEILPLVDSILLVAMESDKSLFFLRCKEFNRSVFLLSKYINEDIPYNFFPREIWFFLCNIFLLSSRYKSYLLCRKKALSMALSHPIDSFTSAIYLLTAASEFLTYNQFINFVSRVEDRLEEIYFKKIKLIGISKLCFGDISGCRSFFQGSFTPDEESFARLLEGKSVAIVGPVDSYIDHGDEIDKFDIVIRLNYKGLTGMNTSSFGTKTNVSFYIQKDLNEFFLKSNNFLQILNGLDYIVCDANQKSSDSIFAQVESPVRPRFKAGHPGYTTLFKGTNNGIQRVIADLMRFNVGKVKVFNSNLFIKNNYAKGYRGNTNVGPIDYGFIRHDPVGNFLFLKKLYENKVIEVDRVLAEILSLSIDEYVLELEKSYSCIY